MYICTYETNLYSVMLIFKCSNVRYILKNSKNTMTLGFPGGAVVKNPPANAGDTGSSPGPGRPHMPQSN